MTVSLCPRCGQFSGTDGARGDAPVCSIVCAPCREQDREPQGDAMSLFTPAPNQMAGQTFLEV